MSRSLFLIIAILFISLSYSQDMSKIKVETNKLEFNTSLSEISSDFVDGNLLFFQNKKALKRYSQYYDLFMLNSANLTSFEGDKRKVSLTKQLTIVTDYHEGPCFVDEINDKIYITISSLDKTGMKREKKLNTLNQQNRLRLLEGDFKDGKISNLKEFPYNDPVYNIGHATYSNATKRLYFVSTMPGTIGKSDIFYCSKKANGSWDTPVNLGRRVNSDESELFPYVKSGILFFSSKGQRRQIGKDLDIYYVKESEILTKSPTELVGANTNSDDFGICFNDKKDKLEGFLTSNRNNKISGNDDIYSFEIKNVIEEKTYDLVVKITNKGEFLKSGIITLIDDKKNELETVDINNDEFNFKGLEKGKQYKLEYDNDELSRDFKLPINLYDGYTSEVFDIENDAIFKDTLVVDKINKLVNKLDNKEKVIAKVDKIKEEIIEPKTPVEKVILIEDTAIIASVKAKEKVIPVSEVKETEVIKFDRKEIFENIYFAYDSYTIFEYSQNKLDKLIKYANSNNAKYIVLNAYTDSRGSNVYNEKLSIKRALATREYLIKNGIPQSKIKYQGFGENNLVNDCGDGVICDDINHIQNRRVEFTLAY